jgi:nicotinamidase/pyrazinamidase
MNRKTVFFDIDTQYDFISPQGKLPVPGAESILDNISAVRQLVFDNGYSIVATTDYHSMDNPEISLEPDFKTTFPPHCMTGEPGAERLGYLGSLNIDYIEVNQTDENAIKKLIEKEQFHIVVRKDSVNPFDSPNVIKLFSLLQSKTVFVFGVALDVCVYNAVKGLKQFSDAAVYLVKDAVKGLGIIPEEQVYQEFEQISVHPININQLKELL